MPATPQPGRQRPARHMTLLAQPAVDRAGTARCLRRRRQPGRRLGWGLADQAMSSLTNVAVSIYVARELGAAQFGAFSLAYVTYAFALNASRGLATDPLMVRFSGADLADVAAAVAQTAPGPPWPWAWWPAPVVLGVAAAAQRHGPGWPSSRSG